MVRNIGNLHCHWHLELFCTHVAWNAQQILYCSNEQPSDWKTQREVISLDDKVSHLLQVTSFVMG